MTTTPPIARPKPGASDLLEWYDRHARDLPWRVPPHRSKQGELPDPYAIWLSEIMLQQTTVATVKDYYRKFLGIWPSVEDLAAATQDDVMKAWAGLGYYSRARNLHKCARIIVSEHGGQFPSTAAGLSDLPGIGPYTSAAIAAIAFGEAVPVVDGNVERVFTRLWADSTPLPAAKEKVRGYKRSVLPEHRAGDFAQAVMDLGATVCTPRRPACTICPWNRNCLALRVADPEDFPVKPPKKTKPTRRGAAFILRDGAGAIWLEKRPSRGLLANMAQAPTTNWNAGQDGDTDRRAAPTPGSWLHRGVARHTFTHFHLELEIYETVTDAREKKQDPTPNGWWTQIDQLQDEALPTLMKKAITVAIPDAFRKAGKP
jgi:A/G-specific adenine glycosylase